MVAGIDRRRNYYGDADGHSESAAAMIAASSGDGLSDGASEAGSLAGSETGSETGTETGSDAGSDGSAEAESDGHGVSARRANEWDPCELARPIATCIATTRHTRSAAPA